jgi:non-canonical poly(A) RNA polymerase PAPD5/7
MLCLRDPADATNDLGRRAIAIRHVQATFKALCYILDRDMRRNTRISLLAPLVGSSYMLYKERRHKLAEYGKRLSDQMKKSLAVKARMIREGVAEVESPKEEDKEALDKAQQEEEALEKAQQEKMRLVREERDREWRRLTEERNKKLSQEAERTAVLKHGDVMPSILGMPSIEDDTDTPPQDFPVEEANPEAEKRSINAV